MKIDWDRPLTETRSYAHEPVVRDRFYGLSLRAFLVLSLSTLVLSVLTRSWGDAMGEASLAAVTYKALEYRRNWLDERALHRWPEFKAKWMREHDT